MDPRDFVVVGRFGHAFWVEDGELRQAPVVTAGESFLARAEFDRDSSERVDLSAGAVLDGGTLFRRDILLAAKSLLELVAE